MKRSLLILAVLPTMSACDDRSGKTANSSPVVVQSVVPPTQQAPTAQAMPEPATAPATKPAQPETVLPTTLMLINGHPFTLEVADDENEQERGLMFRNSLGADQGMIFVFEDERPRGFWMKNTYIALDIAYVAADGRVLNILKMYPQDETIAPSAGPAQYAIELNAGTANRIGLKAGDVLTIPDTIKPRR